jgi:hypothetical protein
MGLWGSTISFFSTYDAEKDECVESPDFSFGECDISGEKGNLVNCHALGDDGRIHNFQAGDWLVGGVLGRIAGAF